MQTLKICFAQISLSAEQCKWPKFGGGGPAAPPLRPLWPICLYYRRTTLPLGKMRLFVFYGEELF